MASNAKNKDIYAVPGTNKDKFHENMKKFSGSREESFNKGKVGAGNKGKTKVVASVGRGGQMGTRGGSRGGQTNPLGISRGGQTNIFGGSRGGQANHLGGSRGGQTNLFGSSRGEQSSPCGGNRGEQSSPRGGNRGEQSNALDGNPDKPMRTFFRPPDPVLPQQEPEPEAMSYNQSQHPPTLPENNPPIQRKPTPENKPSLLLSKEENQTIFEILGKGRQSLSTAVVQYLVPTPDQQKWQKKETGVICLVRDTTKRSYFIQVLSLRTKSMVFRQEIYNQFDYHMPASFFLTFEGDNCMVGINFADITEATNFRDVLDNKLEAKRQRRYERRSKIVLDSPSPNQHNQSQVHHHVASPPPPPVMPNGTTNIVPNSNTYFPFNAKMKKKGKDKDKDKKKLLRKEDIGIPMDFRHIQHVGWDPNKGFDLAGVDSDFRTFFEKAGVSANQLEDENTRQFIYNFIESHGGVEAVKRSVSSTGRAIPNAPSNSSGGPPPVPARQPSIPNANFPQFQFPNQQSTKPAAPPPPMRPVPPPPPAATYPGGSAAPPPPARSTSHVMQNQNNHSYHQNNGTSRPYAPPPPSGTKQNNQSDFVPPPPPPPPPPSGGGPPPPPPPPNMSNGDTIDSSSSSVGRGQPLPVVEDDRSQLMKQIQQGIQLKKVDADAQPKRTGGTLADCLGQIQRGVDLKPVPETVKAPLSGDAMDGLAGALARALADRNKAIHPDSSSSGEEDEDVYDEDEWD